MKTTKYSLCFSLLVTCCTLCVNAQSPNIEILFTDIRSSQGNIIVKIFTDNQSFKDDKEVGKVKFSKADALSGNLIGKISLQPGEYGLALLDDENNNNEMDYNFIGLPKEGFGFSNFYLTGFNRPEFERFKFTVSENRTVKITMKLRYL